jgi:hypothetical protein
VVALVVLVGVPAVTNDAHAAPARYSGACHAAVDAYWPAHLRARAHYIVNRESRGIPSAANRRSSARGCFQMLLRFSAPFYRRVGCSNAQWMVARCNVRAALALHRVAGWSPWRVYR